MGDVDELRRIEQELTPWVRQHVANPDASHGKCHVVKLRHLNVNREVQGDVGAFPVKNDSGTEGVIAPLLHQLADAAQRDADEVNQGVQTYAVYAYYTADRNYAPRKIFRVAPSSEAEIDRNITPSEPANPQGIAAQAMRHVEVMMRQMTVVTATQFQAMQVENKRLSEANERFSQQQIDFVMLFQDTMNMATERRLKERETEAKIAIKEEVLSKLAAIAPVVINRLAGKSIMPEEADPSLMLMSSMLESMSDEQQQQFFSMLTEAQKITLAEIMSQYEQKKSRWIKGRKNQVIGQKTGTPESPASPPETSLSPRRAEPEVVDVESVPMPLNTPLSQNLTAATEKPRDPVLKRFEEDSDNFMARFKNFLNKPSP